jgi:hypothetical protein
MLLFLFIASLVIIYLFNRNLIHVIDNRLKNINLNIQYPFESFENKEIKMSHVNDNKNVINLNVNKKSKIEGYSNQADNSYKEWEINKKKTQVCFKDHIHKNCNYGVTNYADPKDMSEIDYRIFYLNYPANMTLQDYINWLYCYMNKESELPYNHLKNLEKLKAGKELVEEEGILPPPSYYYPALNSEDYFDKMYSNTNEFQTAPPLNSQTGPMLGYNYDEYSEFSQNSDLYGSTGVLRNTDIALKKDAKELYNYINPKDSNSLNENSENEIYHIKNVEV